jgi:hypothetical protein
MTDNEDNTYRVDLPNDPYWIVTLEGDGRRFRLKHEPVFDPVTGAPFVDLTDAEPIEDEGKGKA